MCQPTLQSNQVPVRAHESASVVRAFLLVLIGFILPHSTLAQDVKCTDLHSIRALDPDRAAGVEVDFEATVTYVNGMHEFIFVQSGQDAIFVYSPDFADVSAGQRVRIQGCLAKGDLLPIVSKSKVELIGEGTLPEPEKVAVIGIEHDCRLLEFEFEILQANVEVTETVLYARTESGIDVCIDVKHPGEVKFANASTIAGRRAKVCGVLGLQIAGGAFREPGNTANRIVGYKIFCDSPDNIKTVDNDKLISPPAARAARLSQLANENFAAGRFLTIGQVCLVDYSEPPALIVSDGGNFTRFQLQATDNLHPGMIMRIGGTKRLDPQGDPQFEVDYLRPITLTEFPQPAVFSVEQAVKSFAPDHRVSIEGTPLRIEDVDGEACLILGEGNSTIAVRFQDTAFDSLASLDPKIAGRVRVTGVTKADDQCSFQLIVARANDATLIESKASLSRIVAMGLGILLAICAIAALWIKLLRSKVAQQQRFEAIFDNAGCPIIVFNGKLQIIDANQLTADMSGYSKEELRSMELTQLDRDIPVQAVGTMMAQTMESQEVAIFPSKVSTKDSRQLDVEVHCRNLTRSKDPEVATYIAVFPDTTARMKYEKELEAARDEAIRANKTKSRFVASMSHELRTPLNGVIGMTQLLEKTELTPVQADYLAACRTSGETLLTVIGDVLDFSKMEAGKLELKPEETKLIPFIENVVRSTSLQKATRHVELASFVDPRLGRSVLVDADRFRQVLFNLIGNAIKFTSRGSITVTARCNEVTDQYADVRFVVADTGVGIPEDRIDCLFEAFEQCDASTTRQYGGTGLGLTICKQIVDLMGGQVHAQSVEGEGSEFIVDVRLPFAAHEAPSDGEGKCKSPFATAGQRVAVLGMSEPISKLLCEMFREYQIEASFFDESELVTQGKFDVVLLNGSKGLDAVKKFVTEHASLLFGDSKASILVPVIPADCVVKDEEWKGMGVISPICTPFSQTRLLQAIDPQWEICEADATEPLEFTGLQNRALRILICEDVPVNQMIAKEICRRAGVECVVSDNGKAGIETLKVDSQFDAILMDCHMPVMDGFEATQKIREMTEQGLISRIPIIALTANALSGDREKCLDAGMDDYLAKPFEIDQLLQKIHSHVSAGAQSTEPIFNIEKLLTQIQDRSFALELARQFSDTFPDYQQKLEASLKSKDAKQTFQIAHRLKGSASMLRADRISGIATRIESDVHDGDLKHLQSQLEELLEEFHNFSNAFQQEKSKEVASGE